VEPWVRSAEAVVHPLVFGELLLGGLSRLNEDRLRSLEWCETCSPDDIHGFIRTKRLSGKGLGWVDAALLASASALHAPIATFDSDLERCAQDLGLSRALTGQS